MTAQKNNLPPKARHIGWLFQNYAFFPNMSVIENILFAAVGTKEEKLCGLNENFKRFRLIGLENAYLHKLSGGHQQRVAFARILTLNAQFLLLDEPFSALDSYLNRQLEFELAEILESYNGETVFVSHDKDGIFRFADKIAVLNRGKVDIINTKHELFKNPKTVAALRGCKIGSVE